VSAGLQSEAGARERVAERFYLPELDVLRFFAFFGVFVFHLPPTGFWFFWRYGLLGYAGISGVFGVDLFFTLSGYLLTRLLLRERERTGNIDVKAFYVRRTLRIWPLYYFVLIFLLVLSRLPVSMTSAPPLIVDAFRPMHLRLYFFLAVFLFNFNFANHILTEGLPLMLPLWTISVEEQFYAFWPWVMRYIPARRIVVVPILMIAVACFTRAISIPFKLDTLVWLNTFTRLDPMAVGILIALAPPLNPRTALRVALVVFGFGCWMFASYYCELSLQVSTLKISFGYPAVAIGSGAFLLATIGAKSLRSGSAVARCLTYLGKISYGLYVYNPIAKTFCYIVLFRVLIPKAADAGYAEWTPWAAFVLLNFALNVAMAATSYKLVEAPFLRLKKRFTTVPSREV
jgi:peptidoglycan/LPS O-acetylase OafA/YrhL